MRLGRIICVKHAFVKNTSTHQNKTNVTQNVRIVTLFTFSALIYMSIYCTAHITRCTIVSSGMESILSDLPSAVNDVNHFLMSYIKDKGVSREII